MIKLIILDMYGTLVSLHSIKKIPRPGVKDFLERHKDKTIVVFTDAHDYDLVWADLEKAGFAPYIKKVYNYPYLDEQEYKNLGKACQDFGVKPEEAIFISDVILERDSQSSKKYGTKFVQVPTYGGSQTDHVFDFIRID
jgi:FMN phosphatase YigB (HAD superfamily)